MKKFTSLIMLIALTLSMLTTTPVFAGDTLDFTAEVAVANNSFVYKGSTEDLVIPLSTAAANGTTFNKTTLGYGSLGGHIITASFLSVDKVIALLSGSSEDTLKIISMPTTPKDATVVYSVSLGVKTSYAELVKLSDTKFVIAYKVSGTTTTLYTNVITVNAGKTTLTLGTADSVTIGTSVNPVAARLTATVGVVYYHNATNLVSKTFSTATGTLEVTSTTVKSGAVAELANDMFNNVTIAHTADEAPVVNTLTTDNSTMTVASTLSLAHLADTVEIGDICQMDTTYAVYVYKLGTSIYIQGLNLSTEATGEATLVSTETIGDNFGVNRMLVKLNPTHVIVAVGGVMKSYTLNTSSLALTLFGTDAFESDETYAPVLFDVYGDTAVTNPAIFKTHYDRPNTHFRKNTYIDYTLPVRVGFVATGVAANETCSVQINGVITKTATTLTPGVPLYIDNNSTLTESSAGCADTTAVGKKLRGSSVLMQ